MKSFKTYGLILIAALFLFSGCTKRYVVTAHLKVPVVTQTVCAMGAFSDNLPLNTKEEDKPSMEDINKLKMIIVNEINERDIFITSEDPLNPKYEIRGAILEFKKGSGTLRFLIGFGAGNAKLVTSINLVEVATGDIVFGGNFTSIVSDGLESGAKIFQQTAEDFAKELEKQIKAVSGE